MKLLVNKISKTGVRDMKFSVVNFKFREYRRISYLQIYHTNKGVKMNNSDLIAGQKRKRQANSYKKIYAQS